MKSRILSTGSYVPPKRVTNDDLASVMDTNDAWIQQRTGIKERRFASETNAEMAAKAAQSALESVDKESIDVIIVCTYSPDSLIPTTASIVKRKLGIERSIPCFDLNAACTGFLYGLQVADGFIQSGMYEQVLLIGSEKTSQTLDFTDRSTAILFGDGAGAVVLGPGENGIIETKLYGDDDSEEAITLSNLKLSENPFIEETHNTGLFEMAGSTVFRFAIKAFKESVNHLLRTHDLSVDDIDWVISHQANARIIETAARGLKMDAAKFPMNLEVYGNTSAASIPLLMDELNRQQKLKPGMKIIAVAFGGGLTYGASLIEWT